MKCISWNVNGLRACLQKGFLDFFRDADADLFCLQETKLQPEQVTLELPGYRAVLVLGGEEGLFRHGDLREARAPLRDLRRRRGGA